MTIGSGWRRHQTDSGERYLTYDALTSTGILHAFTLRPAAPPGNAEAGPPVDTFEAAGIRPDSIARPRQVHGAAVARAGAPVGSTHPREADAVVVTGAGSSAAVVTADCVAGILAAPGGEALAVFHAGWRGIVAGVVEAAIAALVREARLDLSGLLLVTGPSVGRCCYEVGSEVTAPLGDLFTAPGERARVIGWKGHRAMADLPEAVDLLAARAGLRPDRIHKAGLCTMCRPDLCWSYRADGRKAGRMWAVAGLPG
jgi:YfiH family protein